MREVEPTQHAKFSMDPRSGVSLWLARVVLAEDRGLADRVVALGIRDRWAKALDRELDTGPETAMPPLSPAEQAELANGESSLRESIIGRLRRGVLTARGLLPDAIEPIAVPASTWDLPVAVDWWNSVIQFAGRQIDRVLIYGACADASSQAPPKRSARLDYSTADEPYVRQALDMIARGAARGAQDAARQLAHRLPGKGKVASKEKRLMLRITARQDSGQS